MTQDNFRNGGEVDSQGTTILQHNIRVRSRVEKNPVPIYLHQCRKTPFAEFGAISKHGGQNRNLKIANPAMRNGTGFSAPRNTRQNQKQRKPSNESVHSLKKSARRISASLNIAGEMISQSEKELGDPYTGALDQIPPHISTEPLGPKRDRTAENRIFSARSLFHRMHDRLAMMPGEAHS
jgi:hypothetical protein